MSKDLFMRAHEQLIEEYMEAHPEADWGEAYEKTTDLIQDRYTDMAASMIDAAKDYAKYNKEPK